jgi:hypothetical protein
MRLLLTRFGASGLDKNKLISLIDTDTGQIPFIDIVSGLNRKDKFFGSGATYSGNWLCIGVNSIERPKSYLLLLHFISGHTNIIELPFSHCIFDIVSVFPGQLYLCSEGTHSLNNVSFSPDTGEFRSDSIHYKLPPDYINFNSLCSHQMRWYGTISNSVIELSNNRIIYSGLMLPHSVFFNSYERICFLENNKMYSGDDIFYFPEAVTSAYEDTISAGYWISSEGSLRFVDYGGKSSDCIPCGGHTIFKMLEVRGCLNEAF